MRLTGADRATLVLGLPTNWVPSVLQALDPGRVPATVVWDDIATPDDGNRFEVASLRLADGTVVQVGAMTQGRTDVLKRFRASFALVLLPMLALGATGVAVLAVRTMRPLQSLIRTVQSITAGALDTRVATHQTASEWDELGRLFNIMLDQIAMLIQGMHDALDNVAHELRTPVARLRASAEVALQQAEAHPALYREALADCLEESERLLTMLRTLMDISEAETGVMPLELEPVQLAALLAEVVDLYRYVIDEHQLDISTTAPPTVWVSADPTRLRQVIANLMDNAIKYTPPGGQITLTACQEPTGVAVVVEDTGQGDDAGRTPPHLGSPVSW